MEVGFQGPRPAQAFRTGALALVQLRAVVTADPAWCADLVARTDVPNTGLPLVLVSIAVSEWLAMLVFERILSSWVFAPAGLIWEVSVLGTKSRTAKDSPPDAKRVMGPYDLKQGQYPADSLLVRSLPPTARPKSKRPSSGPVNGVMASAALTRVASGGVAPAGVEGGADADPGPHILLNPGEAMALATLNAVHATIMRSFVDHWWKTAPANLMQFDSVWQQWRSHRGVQVAKATAIAYAKQVMSGQGMATAAPLPGVQ